MGCDGGSTPLRFDMVRVKKAAAQIDSKEVLRMKWTLCALTLAPLVDPVVACELGFLFTKEAVVGHLLTKSMPEEFSHIERLKDIVTLNLTKNTSHAQSGLANVESYENLISPFMCPLSNAEMNGSHRFVYLRLCGCVFSQAALAQLQTTSCPLCTKHFTSEDIITLNGTALEVEVLREKMIMQRAQKALKKPKKPKAEAESALPTATLATAPLPTALLESAPLPPSGPQLPPKKGTAAIPLSSVSGPEVQVKRKRLSDEPDPATVIPVSSSSYLSAPTGVGPDGKRLRFVPPTIVSAVLHHSSQKHVSSSYASIFHDPNAIDRPRNAISTAW